MSRDESCRGIQPTTTCKVGDLSTLAHQSTSHVAVRIEVVGTEGTDIRNNTFDDADDSGGKDMSKQDASKKFKLFIRECGQIKVTGNRNLSDSAVDHTAER